jgi:hypothetical protein
MLFMLLINVIFYDILCVFVCCFFNYIVLFLCPCALSAIGLTPVVSYTLVLKYGIELNLIGLFF